MMGEMRPRGQEKKGTDRRLDIYVDINMMARQQRREAFPMAYVDGYVLPIPTRNLAAYRRMAAKAAKIWREHGALEVRECVGEDLAVKKFAPMSPFPRLLKTKHGETVVFSWIVFKSRAHRDRVNAKVISDPRLGDFDPTKMPFDMKRMVYGGFKTIVAV
jgi:uncharacterized protein YbaA (DUF1428 family)